MAQGRRAVWKFFLVHQVEEEQAWLEFMARQGWHLRRAQRVRFVFERGAPQESRYRLDYQFPGVDQGEYLALFRDASWELVDHVNGWYYFRSDDPAAPEIFTDVESRRGLMLRQMRWLGFAFLMQVPGIVHTLTSLNHRRPLLFPMLIVQISATMLLLGCFLALFRAWRRGA